MSSEKLLQVLLLVTALYGVCLARRRDYPLRKNITACDSSPSGMDTLNLDAYKGRWYVSRITTPLSSSLKDVKGYAAEIDFSSIESNKKDKVSTISGTRKEILVKGDSRDCIKRTWKCESEVGTSVAVCQLSSDKRGIIRQKVEVIATDYQTTSVVYVETYVGSRMLSRQVNLLVRSPGMEPDPSVYRAILQEWCGEYAADPGSEFYKTFSNDSNLSCFRP